MIYIMKSVNINPFYTVFRQCLFKLINIPDIFFNKIILIVFIKACFYSFLLYITDK